MYIHYLWSVSDLCIHLLIFPLKCNQSADIGLWNCGWLPSVWHHNQISAAHSYLHDLLRNLLLSKSRPYNSVLLSRNSSHQYCLAGEWLVPSTRAKSASQQLPFLGMQNIYQYIYVHTFASMALYLLCSWGREEKRENLNNIFLFLVLLTLVQASLGYFDIFERGSKTLLPSKLTIVL